MPEDSLKRETIRAYLKRFLVTVIDARGPKVVARDLTTMGWPYPEGTVRTWRGEKNPPPDVVFALSAKYGVSIDEFVSGEALERTLADQLADHGRRLERLEARLEGWEIEETLARGGFVSGNQVEETVADAWARWRERVAELEAAVSELRKKEA